MERLKAMRQGNSTAVTLSIIAFSFLCVVCVAGLVALGRDVGQLVYFIGGFVPVTVGVILANQKIDNVGANVADIQHQVNGNMTARIDGAVEAVKDHIDTAVNGDENGSKAATP